MSRRRWMGVRRSAESDERGAVVVFVALLITALFTVTALVIDLSLVRQNRQADKSATDFAAAAGIRALDDGSGFVRPWRGICAAREYLVANNDELEPLTHVDAAGTAIADPCETPSSAVCTPSASTWATYTGLADGGRIRVTIQNGYDLTASGFAEDSNEYAADVGGGPCDHLAVIIEEGEDAYFGGVAGASGYETTIRSVARLQQGTDGDTVAALVLLERHDCQALDVSGTEETIVRIEGNGVIPGVIHSDSLGDGANCNRTIYDVDGTVDQPRIFAGAAEVADPETGLASGLISARSLSGEPGAVPANTSLGTDWVCAQVEASDCLGSGGGSGPTARGLIGRSRVDARYREPIIDLRQAAKVRFGWDGAAAALAGFEVVACNDPRTVFDSPKVFIDCGNGNQSFLGAGKTFTASVDEVVITGAVDLGGSLHLHSPAAVYIKGNTSGPANTISLTNGDAVRVNDAGSGSCADRYSDAPTARTKLVIGNGRIKASGGLLRLCQTTLFMMDSSGSTACPVPDADGAAPYDNGCKGNVSVSGQTVVDWTAPNAENDPNDLPSGADFANFEDLALWSETSGSGGSAWSVVGGGGLRLSGVFFTPNANPLSIGGGGSIDIREAQIITRKLNVSGGGVLAMQPEAHNSVLIPVLGGFTLVR